MKYKRIVNSHGKFKGTCCYVYTNLCRYPLIYCIGCEWFIPNIEYTQNWLAYPVRKWTKEELKKVKEKMRNARV